MYLTKACLLGFKKLYEKYGFFEVTEDMIFFDQKGKVKVWICADLSKFIPNLEPEYYNNLYVGQIKQSQTEMINNLINVIEKNVNLNEEERRFSFKDYLKQHNILDRLSFSKALKYFDSYIADERLHVEDKM